MQTNKQKMQQTKPKMEIDQNQKLNDPVEDFYKTAFGNLLLKVYIRNASR